MLPFQLMLSMEANNIQSAMNAPLPLLTLGSIPKTTTAVPTAFTDERLSDDSFISLTNRMEVRIVSIKNGLFCTDQFVI